MATVHELRVALSELDPSRLLGAAIQSPAANEESTTTTFRIAGWALGREAPVEQVQVVHGGRVVQAAAVQQPRPGVASRFSDTEWAGRSGFALMVDTREFEPAFDVLLQAVLADQTTVPLARISGRRQPLRSEFEPSLQPLIVTSLGRTGTTWLMRLLAEHPAIVAYRRYPYEVRPGLYWLHVLKVLSAPADHANQVAQPHGFYVDKTIVGANPFFASAFHEYPQVQEWMGTTYAERLATFCQASIDGWYRCLAAAQRQPEAAFFAEKHLPDDFPALAWELYPKSREVFLVRDFRDMASSILAFNARRGYDDFGRQRASTDEEFLGQLRHGATRLAEAWRRRSDRAHLVRYEDLIAAPAETLDPLLAYLGLDASATTIDGMLSRASEETPELRRHQTSQTPAASIGRWRSDLSPALQAVAHDAFADLLTEFGYRVEVPATPLAGAGGA